MRAGRPVSVEAAGVHPRQNSTVVACWRQAERDNETQAPGWQLQMLAVPAGVCRSDIGWVETELRPYWLTAAGDAGQSASCKWA